MWKVDVTFLVQFSVRAYSLTAVTLHTRSHELRCDDTDVKWDRHLKTRVGALEAVVELEMLLDKSRDGAEARGLGVVRELEDGRLDRRDERPRLAHALFIHNS